MLVALLVAFAAIAQGSSVGMSGATVVYVADPGEVNVLTFSPVGNDVIVDDSVPIVPCTGCVQGSDNTMAVCTGTNLTRIDADTGDMDDIVTSAGLIGATLRGGAGDDVMAGSDGNDALYGDAGIGTISGGLGDYLIGGVGFDTVDYSDRVVSIVADLDGASDDGASGQNDRNETDVEAITGGSAADVLDENKGVNTLNGGPGDDVLGADSVSYANRTEGLTIKLDGLADDGEAGEADNVHADIENITGGLGDDVIHGSAAANTLFGGPGDDILDGAGGPDVLSGGIGVDTVDYSLRLVGVSVDLDGIPDDGEPSEGDNVVTDIENIPGGSGADTLRGGGGRTV